MKALLLSDLHFEFHQDRGRTLCGMLDPTGIDVVVLAGDIATPDCLVEGLNNICQRFPNSEILYCHGNHEFYGADTRQQTIDQTIRAQAANKNLTWLDNEIKVIDGQRFLGTPLWFRKTADTMLNQKNWSDFSACGDFATWVYKENKKALDFLDKNLQEGDFLFTHMLPCEEAVSMKWKGDVCNCFFVCDINQLIRERKPKVVQYGHSHDNMDFTMGPTRLINNAFGYVGSAVSPAFNPKLIIDL